ncbi:MAG: hypothetical protein PHQ59_03760 [Candidatus Daviesbacteria bacterium]|nr:hypothetical protein [Candidatus Daviesbacteria bacterium]
MNNQKLIVESLAMDLKRVSLGLYRGSNVMAERFKEESLKRSNELESENLDSYLMFLILKMKEALAGDKEYIADDLLMYSTLFQNYALTKMV